MVTRATTNPHFCVVEAPVTVPMLRRSAVAEMFGVCERTVKRWADAGFLDEVRVGPRSVRVTSESVDALAHVRAPERDRPQEDTGHANYDPLGAASRRSGRR